MDLIRNKLHIPGPNELMSRYTLIMDRHLDNMKGRLKAIIAQVLLACNYIKHAWLR